MTDDHSRQLISDLPSWRVTLRTDDVLDIAAHGYSVQEEMYLFSALLEGTPPRQVILVKMPAHLVANVSGG